jgi:TolB protein
MICARSIALLACWVIFSFNANSQVANGEGYTPMEGVVIPKTPISQPQTVTPEDRKVFDSSSNDQKNIAFKRQCQPCTIAIANFRGENFRGEDNVPQKIIQIVAADLERSGQFRSVPAGMVIDEVRQPDFEPIRQKTADSLLTGSVSRMADGRFDVRFRLWDSVKGESIIAQSYVVVPADLRRVSHLIADVVYEKLTGDKGIFSTRIAYITKQGPKHMLWVADADGENSQAALTSPEPIISPSWSPNGNELAYVSFESRKPVVWVHDIASGKRRILANFKGSNSAPAWSPDGEKLAVVLSKDDDNSQIYIVNKNGGESQRLMVSQSIDTEPIFSADGNFIYFVSDRSGSPQIYRIPTIGGNAQRITFVGNFNISPSISPDGKWLSYISRVAGAYKLHVMDLSNNKVMALTDSYADKRPTFAPNGKNILYSTESLGSEVLMTTTLDGKTRSRLVPQASKIQEPSWGPFFNP